MAATGHINEMAATGHINEMAATGHNNGIHGDKRCICACMIKVQWVSPIA